ncbi:AraC family transcriptional regulator [Bordetella genomosp. 13]|uniref:AraC family transcriptional regulator n=1 Tax=Bordetella genomosp. 13 TaxID=463040 RepID=UPI00119FD6A8|nr:helix-turn-helix transcriptional regulator [Bordetella genomosp. 13]
MTTKRSHIVPSGPPPDPISCRIETYPLGAVFPEQKADWGKLLYAVSGVAEFVIEGNRLLSPPAYGIWIPAGLTHSSTMLHAARYAKVFIRVDLCAGLPDQTCTIALSNLVKAIVADFANRGVTVPSAPEDMRLSTVLVDQIRLAPRTDSYLPFTEDPVVGQLLAALQAEPGDRRSIAQWADAMHMTERTLSRRFKLAVGLSFGEWRQRLRLLTALSHLKSGDPVQVTASKLGFSTTSAFIAAFRQATGTSPGRSREGVEALAAYGTRQG